MKRSFFFWFGLVCLFLCVMVSGCLLWDNFFFQAGHSIRIATPLSCKAFSSFHHVSFQKQNFQAFSASWCSYTAFIIATVLGTAFGAQEFQSMGLPLSQKHSEKNLYIATLFLKKSWFFYSVFDAVLGVWQLKEAFSQFRTSREHDTVHHSVI